MKPMGGRQLIMWDLAISLIIISSAFMVARIYVRFFMIKTPGWDDAFAIFAWIFLLAQASIEVAATYNGSGRTMSDVAQSQINTYFVLLPTAQLLYFLGTGCVRLSLLAFLPRLNKENTVRYSAVAVFYLGTKYEVEVSCLHVAEKFLKVVYVVGAGIVILTVGAFFALLFECTPVKALWNKNMPGARCTAPNNEAILMYTHSGLSIFFDFVLLAMPIWVLHKRMIFSVKTIKVALVFAVGVFTIVTGIIRLTTILSIDMSKNTTYNVTYAAVWTNLEGHCGLWVCCFPALQPLIRRLASRIGLRSPLRKGSSANSSSKRRSSRINNAGDATLTGSTGLSSFLAGWLRKKRAQQSSIDAPKTSSSTDPTISSTSRPGTSVIKSSRPSADNDGPIELLEIEPAVFTSYVSGGGKRDSGAVADIEDEEEEDQFYEISHDSEREESGDEPDVEVGEGSRSFNPWGGIMRTTTVSQDTEPRSSVYERVLTQGWRDGSLEAPRV